MRKLKYTLMSAADISDPRKRASVLAAAALEELETVLLVAKALHMAEKAAQEVEDEEMRERSIDKVYRVMSRSGYDIDKRAFDVRELARSIQQTPS